MHESKRRDSSRHRAPPKLSGNQAPRGAPSIPHPSSMLPAAVRAGNKLPLQPNCRPVSKQSWEFRAALLEVLTVARVGLLDSSSSEAGREDHDWVRVRLSTAGPCFNKRSLAALSSR